MALFARLDTVLLCFPLQRGAVRHLLVCAAFYSTVRVWRRAVFRMDVAGLRDCCKMAYALRCLFFDSARESGLVLYNTPPALATTHRATVETLPFRR